MIADLITVDKDLCIGCGLCASVCPYATIKLEDGHPVAVKVADINQSQCCGCGHCVSVCPKAALDNKFAPLSAQKPIDKSIKSFSEQDAAAFLIGRRSIRYFEDKPVPESVLLKLLDVAKYAPTGCNLQGIKFLIIQDKVILNQIKEAGAKFLELQAKISTPPGQYLNIQMAEAYRSGTDTILHGAPCVVILLHPKDPLPFGEATSSNTMTYLQLYATTLGLGMCWAGVIEAPMQQGYKEMQDALQIPDGWVVRSAAMLGYAKYEHQRIPERNKVDVIFR